MAFLGAGAYQAITVDKALVSGGLGVTGGVGQTALTAVLDGSTTPPPNFLNPITDTGGQAINLATGGAALTVSLIGLRGHGPTKSHPGANLAMAGYGITTLTVGWLAPKLLAMSGVKTAAKAAAAARVPIGARPNVAAPAGQPLSGGSAVSANAQAVDLLS